MKVEKLIVKGLSLKTIRLPVYICTVLFSTLKAGLYAGISLFIFFLKIRFKHIYIIVILYLYSIRFL